MSSYWRRMREYIARELAYRVVITHCPLTGVPVIEMYNRKYEHLVDYQYTGELPVVYPSAEQWETFTGRPRDMAPRCNEYEFFFYDDSGLSKVQYKKRLLALRKYLQEVRRPLGLAAHLWLDGPRHWTMVEYPNSVRRGCTDYWDDV